MARSLTAFLGLIVSLTAVVAQARDAGTSKQPLNRQAAEVHDVLDAEAAGLVTVKFIPNDSRSAQILVTNKSNQPLTLKMPAAYAGVPVLRQMGPGGMGGGMGGMGGGMGGMGGGMGGGQAMGGGGMGGMGGGMGGMGGGMGGMGGGMGGMPGGAFSVPPEKTKVMRITTVCLEHGKKEPSSRMAYKLVALETFSTDPKLQSLLEALGRGELSQKVAQAATWHVANGLTWEALSAKKIDRLGRPDDAWFTPNELMMAHRSVAVASERAAAAADEPLTPSASQEAGR
jgi:hypothetical protein